MKQASFVHIFLYVVFTSLFCIGLASLVCTQIPYEWIKLQMDALSVDGDAERFTPLVYANIIAKLYLLGATALLCSGLTFIYKAPIAHILNQNLNKWITALRECFQDTVHHVRSFYQQTDRTHIMVLCILVLGGILFRLYFLFQPIRHDEAFTFTNYASKPLILGLSNYSFPNNHLFHTLCVHISYFLFGNQLWAIRLPAFLAGILLLPITYFLVRALYDSYSALITTSLISVSSALIEYGTNARGYAFVILFFQILLLLANYLRQKDNVAAWSFLAFFAALGLYTVPVMLYPFVTVLFWITWSAWQNDFSLPLKTTLSKVLIYGALTTLFTGLFYLPVLLASGLDAIIHNRFVQPMSLSAFIAHLPVRLEDVWSQWSRDYNTGLTILLVMGTIISLSTHRQLSQHHICLALPAVLSLAILLPIQGVLPPERVWLYLLPLFFTLSSAGIWGLFKRVMPNTILAKTAIMISLCFGAWNAIGAAQTLNTYYPYGPGTLKDAETITQYLKPHLQSSDRLLTIATAAPLEYYFRKHNVAINHLRQDINISNRVFVLVLEKKYTLEQVLKTSQISTQDFTAPNLLRAYPSARLYEMNRLSTTWQPQMGNTYND